MGHAGNGLVHLYAKADDDFKRDAAAKLEAFVTAKTAATDKLAESNRWLN
jgi:hypothetical protein